MVGVGDELEGVGVDVDETREATGGGEEEAGEDEEDEEVVVGEDVGTVKTGDEIVKLAKGLAIGPNIGVAVYGLGLTLDVNCVGDGAP